MDFARQTFTCARCGKPAAVFSRVPAGVSLTPGDLWRERERLQRSGFMGNLLQWYGPEKLAAVWEALERRDYEAVAEQAGDDLVGFHCWQCACDYCEACWRIGPPEFDADFPGFYDCTAAVCPAGHEQVVDD